MDYDTINAFLPPNRKGSAMETFDYAGEVLPLAANARVTQNITVQNDADFLILAACARVSDPANEATVFTDPAITAQINDTGSADLESIPVAFGALFSVTGLAAGGAAGLAGAFPFIKLFKAGSTIRTTFVNLLAATTFNVRYSYRGVKVYYYARGA